VNLIVQEVIHELKLGSEAKSVDTTPTIEFDFKAKFAETKAAAKVCDVSTVFLHIQRVVHAYRR